MTNRMRLTQEVGYTALVLIWQSLRLTKAPHYRLHQTFQDVCSSAGAFLNSSENQLL